MRRMPSSHGRNVALAVFVFVLTFSPYAHAAGSIATSNAQPAFLKNLQLRDAGPDVQLLQKFLNALGFLIAQAGPGSPGNETIVFGLRTFRALVRYQQAHAFPATGFFGPLTRGAINSTPSAGNAPSNVSANLSGSQ